MQIIKPLLQIFIRLLFVSGSVRNESLRQIASWYESSTLPSSVRYGSSCTVFWKDARHRKRFADKKKLVANRVNADAGRRSIVWLEGSPKHGIVTVGVASEVAELSIFTGHLMNLIAWLGFRRQYSHP